MKQALASMGDDLGLQKCTLTSLESRIEVQINEALERIHRFQAGVPCSSNPFFRIFTKTVSCEFFFFMSSCALQLKLGSISYRLA